jgi:hypothetical protein
MGVLQADLEKTAHHGARRVAEFAALLVLTLGLWVVPAMVSQGQDRVDMAPAARHVDAGIVGADAEAGAAFARADGLALALAATPLAKNGSDGAHKRR